MKKFLASIIISLIFVTSCSESETPSDQTLSIASWGGNFQKSLVNDWLEPSLSKKNIKINSNSWSGNYSALENNIKMNITDYDLIHVESHFLNSKSQIFTSLSDQSQVFKKHLPLEFINKHNESLTVAFPILEYGYVLTLTDAYNGDAHNITWRNFFNPKNSQYKALRDSPIGNIEISLLSLENGEQKSRAIIDKIKDKVIWWTTGNHLQNIISNSQADMVAAWTGRILNAHLEQGQNHQNGGIRVSNIATKLVSIDWFIIPKNSKNKALAKEAISLIYQNNTGARNFSLSSGYKAPVKNIDLNDTNPTKSKYLNLGSISGDNNMAINPVFWSKNYNYISKQWKLWRSN